jgi:hypothetical protein
MKKIVEVLEGDIWKAILFQDLKIGDIVRFRDPKTGEIIKDGWGSGFSKVVSNVEKISDDEKIGDSEYGVELEEVFGTDKEVDEFADALIKG